MTITREQVADLREGDVVELTCPDWPDGSVIRGALHASRQGALYCCVWPIRYQGGEAIGRNDFTLTVVSRAPRPLYVNHPRTEPVPGDVVRFVSDDHPDESYTNVFLPRTEHDGLPWLSLTHDPGERYSREDAEAAHLAGWLQHLLVDGETGQVVPS